MVEVSVLTQMFSVLRERKMTSEKPIGLSDFWHKGHHISFSPVVR
jgi:hypothetical protein